LRVSRSNLTWSCADVEWHYVHRMLPKNACARLLLFAENLLVTGSTNSQVVIWDLNSAVPTKPGMSQSVLVALTLVILSSHFETAYSCIEPRKLESF